MRNPAAYLPVALASLAALGLLSFGVTKEIPLGTVEGTLTMKENGKAIPKASVLLTPKGVPAAEMPSRRFTTDSNGKFRARIPAGEYTLEFSAKAHQADPQTIAVTEGKTQTIANSMAPMPPYLELYAAQRVFLPSETPQMEVHGFEPSQSLRVRIHRLDVDKVARVGGSLYELLSKIARHSKGIESDPAQLSAFTQDLNVPIRERDAEGTFVQDFKLPSLEEGLYWVSCSLGKFQQGQYLNVSRIGLVAKTSKNQTVAYLGKLDTGEPIRGANLRAFVGGKPAISATTGPDGVAEFGLPDGGAMLLAESGGSRAIVDLEARESNEQALKLFGYTDRPVYKPGDEVNFKGILRTFKQRRYALPATTSLSVEIRDESDVLLKRETVTTDELGTFHGSFQVGKEAAPGEYRVVVRADDFEDSIGFGVAAYRKPEFTVSVKPLEPFYLLGQTAKMKVECKYYFGGPVPGAKVQAYVYRDPLYPTFPGDEEYAEFLENSSYGEYLEEKEFTTDANGQVIVEIPTKPGDSGNQDYIYRVECSVAEAGDRYFDGSGTVKAYQGGLQLSVAAVNYVAKPNTDGVLELSATAVAPDQKLGGVPVTVRYGKETWSGNVATFVEEGVATATLGPDGKATASIPTGPGGTRVVKVTAKDFGGREVGSDTEFWVEGGDYGRSESALQLALDKKRYQQGESAKLLVRSDTAGSVLITVETDRVLFKKVVSLPKGSTTVQIPVNADCFPNATVAATRISNKILTERTASLVVEYGPRKLLVQISPDRTVVQPGEKVSYKVKTTLPNGSPVPADVSVAVVDESVYDIRKDGTDILRGFYPKRYADVRTAYSFAEIYLDGGDKGGDIPVRSDFRDTAAWIPNVRTDARGEATVEVPLPDNLTEWRATAVAASADTAVGMATTQLQARKPLMVRLQVPPYLVEGDEFTAMVTVQGDARGAFKLRLEPQGIEIKGEAQAELNLSGEPVPLPISLIARQSGNATLTAKAWIEGGPSDGMELPIRIVAKARTLVTQETGRAPVGETDLVPSEAPVPGATLVDAKLTVTPSIASGMFQSLDDLIGFPYGCVEQTMSRFLPALLLSQTLSTVDFPQKARIPEIVADGLTRLRRMQHADGGWGWWEYDSSDDFMTAFVLDGLQRAQQAGYAFPDSMAKTALTWIETRLTGADAAKVALRDRLYLSWVLARYGRPEMAKSALKGADFAKASHADWAMAALAYASSGNLGSAGQALARLQAAATQSRSAVTWKATDTAWGEEATAYGLLAFGLLRPEDEIVPRIVQGLMASRRAGGWMSTRDTCFALTALAQVVARLEDLGGQKRVEVLADGQSAKAFDLGPDALTGPSLNADLAANAGAKLRVEGGPVYYAVQRTWADADLDTPRESEDLTISRDYRALATQRMEDGTLRVLPGPKPVTEARSGDLLKCTITLKAVRPIEFLLVEDYIPANFKVQEQESPAITGDWSYWWDRIVVRQDRVAFFRRTLDKGEHTFSYVVRAESTGSCLALPAVAGNMYSDRPKASTTGLRMKVNR